MGDLLATVTVVGIWLGLFPVIRRVQPIVDPVFLAVMLTSMLGFVLAAFVGRKQSRTISIGCALLAAICAIVLARICVTRYQ